MAATSSLAQGKEKKNDFKLNLKNALVIGQFDDPQDRYLIEIALTEMLNAQGVKSNPSLNVLKLGESASSLLMDSVQTSIKEKNIDTYLMVSVRGYDKKYRPSSYLPTMKEAIEGGNIYSLYKADIVSVSFDFKFFRDGVCVYNDIVKCGSVGDRDGVMKKFRKKVSKRIIKAWL